MAVEFLPVTLLGHDEPLIIGRRRVQRIDPAARRCDAVSRGLACCRIASYLITDSMVDFDRVFFLLHDLTFQTSLRRRLIWCLRACALWRLRLQRGL